MKKISLKSIKTDELLSREELKQIMGGASGSGENCEDKCGPNTLCPPDQKCVTIECGVTGQKVCQPE